MEYNRDLHGELPDEIDAADLVPDPDGRYGHYLHKPTGNTISLHNPPRLDREAAPAPITVKVETQGLDEQKAVLAALQLQVDDMAKQLAAAKAPPAK